MPSWKKLDEQGTVNWVKELEKKQAVSSEEKFTTIKQYYQYLAAHQHEYAELAHQIICKQGFESRLANNYLRQVVQKAGIEFNESKRHDLMLGLAIADAKSRKSNFGDAITAENITKYHHAVFEKQEIPKEAWMGTLFENYLRPGSFMLGRGSPDQQGGPIEVKLVNAFTAQIGQAGSEAHQQFAHLAGVLFGEDVFCKTILEAPIEATRFLIDLPKALEGQLSAINQPQIDKLFAQYGVRSAWKGCYTSFDNTESLYKTWGLLAGGMPGEALYENFVSQPEFQCTQAARLSCRLQAQFPELDPAKEAAVEYERVYGKPLQETKKVGQFIATCGRSTLPDGGDFFPAVSKEPIVPSQEPTAFVSLGQPSIARPEATECPHVTVRPATPPSAAHDPGLVEIGRALDRGMLGSAFNRGFGPAATPFSQNPTTFFSPPPAQPSFPSNPGSTQNPAQMPNFSVAANFSSQFSNTGFEPSFNPFSSNRSNNGFGGGGFGNFGF